MKTSSIDNSTTSSTTSTKRWRIEQFLKNLVGKRSSTASGTQSTSNPAQKVSKSPSAYDLLPQKSSRCGSITSLNKDRLINKSTASLNSTSMAMVHQKLWSVVPLLNQNTNDHHKKTIGASCTNLLASLNATSVSSPSSHNRMRKCETVCALTDDQDMFKGSRQTHWKSINSLLEPIRPMNRLRNSQSCYVNNCDPDQSFTTARQLQTCSHCSSLLSLAAVGNSNYSLTNDGAFVLKNSCSHKSNSNNNSRSSGSRTKRSSAKLQDDLDDEDHNLIEDDFETDLTVKLPLVIKGQSTTVLATKFTCKLCLGEFYNEDKLTTIESCGCTFCTEVCAIFFRAFY